MTELSILDLFILSCIDRGLNSAYLMQREAGLSLGATSPILPRLLKAGLVRRGTARTATNRPRHEYSLTSMGTDQVQEGWKKRLKLDAPPSDIDATLRLVDLAMFYDGDTARLTELIKRAAILRNNMAERCSLEAADLGAPSSTLYRSLRARLDCLRFRAEADGLKRLGADLGRRRTKPKSKKQSRAL